MTPSVAYAIGGLAFFPLGTFTIAADGAFEGLD